MSQQSDASPDVPNVPDVWGLLEEAANVERVDRERLYYFVGRVRTALAQRDRFVLVPKEPTPEIEHAWYNGPTSTHNRFREHWRNALAAAPKPQEKP